MSNDDSTSANHISRPSGEWNQFSDIIQRLDRIEQKQDRATRDNNENDKAIGKIETRLDAVEEWRKVREDVGRSWTLGTWLSVLGSVSGPIATLIILGTHK